ncbi:MAG: hypothetical protein CM15mP86_03590 [Gammaproteobacteria bacterium]|nr:MAG: hypothetical protein CM15mP86_03590 [Gammaproteobacteria bacterium]
MEGLLPHVKYKSSRILEGGVSSEVFLITVESKKGEEKIVLRTEGGPPAENSIKTEYLLLEKLHQTKVPCAKPIHLDHSKEILDKDFMLMTYLEGTIEIPKIKNFGFLNKMVGILKNIHNVDTKILPTLPCRFDPTYDLFEFLPNARINKELKAILKGYDTSYSGKPVLLHGDFWPGNILWTKDEISGVLDWEYAAIGDPVSDLAVASLELKYDYGKRGVDRFLDLYSKNFSIDQSRFSLWLIYVSASTLFFIDEWNLEKARKNLMKREAMLTIEEEIKFLSSQ